jgi:hypothetical protein
VKELPIWGLMAEFTSAADLAVATRRAREAGYRRMDAYSPFGIEAVTDELGFHSTRVPLVTLIGGIFGGLAGFFLQYWVSVLNYPINVGGRALNSWPAFIVVTFECTILGASVSALLGMLALNGLPQPYHPVFNVPRFAFASKDRFFLAIQSEDPKFDIHNTFRFLEGLGARDVQEIPN